MPQKVITVVGARPQFIKAAAVSRAITSSGSVEELIVHTGQHYDPAMSDVFFQQMSIPKPAYNLGVSGLTHGAMTAQMLEAIEKVIIDERPDKVLVYGDTNSTLAGALAAVKLHVPVVHVEAGLRSFNMLMPEEVNRILTDRVSSQLFCPTQQAVLNLHNEGYANNACQIELTGDVMQDAALFYARQAVHLPLLEQKSYEGGFVLATLHRAENTDDVNALQSIVTALNLINQTLPVILPLHPRTKKLISALDESPKFTIIEPVGYLEMIGLIQHCSIVMTDSGGLQKEAYFFAKPCVTMREQTEWVELISAKVNILVGSNTETIVAGFNSMLGASVTDTGALYGGGLAAQRIVELL